MKRPQTREAKKPDPAWKLMRLGDVFEQRTQRGSAGLPVLSVTMDRGLVARDSVEKKMKQSLPPEESLLVQPGDIVYNTMRMWQGAVAYSDREGVVSPAYVVCRPKADLIDGQFMHCLFKSREGQNKLQAFSHGLTEDRLRLYFDDFAEIPFRLPPLSEQRRIAEILKTWDDALTKLERLIDAQERRYQGLLEKLVTGKRRLPQFSRPREVTIKNRHGTYPSDWSRVRLGDVTKESSVRANTITGGIVLSCTKHQGLVPSDEYFGKRVYAFDTSAYKVVRHGEFAYATNHIEEGSIGYQNICEIGLVSPIYTVFKTDDSIDVSYFFRLLKSSLMIHLYRVNTSASVDRRGSLRYGEFSEIKINLPGKAEQKAIAAYLESADAEIRLLRQKHAALTTQKRGIVQLLLTAKKRVHI